MALITKVIAPEEDGSTVRHILRSKLHFSSHAVSRLAHGGECLFVNGTPVHTPHVLRAGDTLTVETEDRRPPKTTITPGDWPLPVVWEDAHLLIVNKPSGMTAHASNFLPHTPTVAGALAWSRGADFIFHPVNRLDKGTTGLMAVAKSGYVHDLLRRRLHTDDFRREYRAVCLGTPPQSQGTVDAPIGRAGDSLVARCVRQDGAPAVSHYKVLARGEGLSFLALWPETGRTHQLRVHMAHLGCPLAGDWLYGTEDPALISRPALHSYAVSMVHPVTGKTVEVSAPLPEDLLRLLHQRFSQGADA
ncbi:MAG: RluA family pseudouridine synthase [Oscillibacter sp.]|nr:RluA family pseudouridine synthase [Oscillibacter sp.]